MGRTIVIREHSNGYQVEYNDVDDPRIEVYQADDENDENRETAVSNMLMNIINELSPYDGFSRRNIRIEFPVLGDEVEIPKKKKGGLTK